jgi:hypothetical protein
MPPSDRWCSASLFSMRGLRSTSQPRISLTSRPDKLSARVVEIEDGFDVHGANHTLVISNVPDGLSSQVTDFLILLRAKGQRSLESAFEQVSHSGDHWQTGDTLDPQPVVMSIDLEEDILTVRSADHVNRGRC